MSLREKAIEAATKAIYRVSMFDPGERSPQIDKLIERDARVTTEAAVTEVIKWLDEQEQTGYIGPNFKQVLARQIADEFALEQPRSYIKWFDDGGNPESYSG